KEDLQFQLGGYRTGNQVTQSGLQASRIPCLNGVNSWGNQVSALFCKVSKTVGNTPFVRSCADIEASPGVSRHVDGTDVDIALNTQLHFEAGDAEADSGEEVDACSRVGVARQARVSSFNRITVGRRKVQNLNRKVAKTKANS